jgi:hypothetical protein
MTQREAVSRGSVRGYSTHQTPKLDHLRQATQTGRPMGAQDFVRIIAHALGRPLAPSPPGPKLRQTAAVAPSNSVDWVACYRVPASAKPSSATSTTPSSPASCSRNSRNRAAAGCAGKGHPNLRSPILSDPWIVGPSSTWPQRAGTFGRDPGLGRCTGNGRAVPAAPPKRRSGEARPPFFRADLRVALPA